jgi:hypothetical protein
VNEAGESTALRATEVSPQETLPFPAMATDAPMCAECGGMMTRNGSCYKCENCGGTSNWTKIEGWNPIQCIMPGLARDRGEEPEFCSPDRVAAPATNESARPWCLAERYVMQTGLYRKGEIKCESLFCS